MGQEGLRRAEAKAGLCGDVAEVPREVKPFAFVFRDQEGKLAHLYLHAKDHADAEIRLDRARINGEAQEIVTMKVVPKWLAKVFGG